MREADMRKRLLVGLGIVIAFLLAAGCENNPTGNDVSLNEEEIKDYISYNLDFKGYFAFDEYYGEEDTVPPEVQTRTITNPHIWYREPQDINREISVNIVNDSAFVSFWSRVDGVFHVLEKDISASPGTLIDHQKDLIDVSHNYAIFKRYEGVSAYGGYRLESLTGIGVSGAEVQPSDCVWVRIDSVRINCESYEDTLITTPLVFFHREELLSFGGQEVVTLTIYSSSSPYYNIYAYLHANSLGHWRRWRLEEIETGIWQGYWVTPLISGIRAIAFDIVEKETIDEEEWRYLSSIWLLPYKIE
jgi:hypothetical protein